MEYGPYWKISVGNSLGYRVIILSFANSLNLPSYQPALIEMTRSPYVLKTQAGLDCLEMLDGRTRASGIKALYC